MKRKLLLFILVIFLILPIIIYADNTPTFTITNTTTYTFTITSTSTIILSPTITPTSIVITSWEVVGYNKQNDRIYSQAEVLNNKIYVLGGNYMYDKGGLFKPVNDVISSINGIDWNIVTNNAKFMPRYGHSLSIFNNVLYLFGGYVLDNGFKRFEQDIWYNPDGRGDSWYNPTTYPMIGKRAFQSMVTFNNKLWIMGGISNTGAYADIWNSADGIHWNKILSNAPWGGRYQMSALVYNGQMYIIGGKSWYENILNDVWSSSDGINWAQISTSLLSGNFEGIVYNGRIVIVESGSYISNIPKKVYESFNGISWNALPAIGIKDVPCIPIVLNDNLYICVFSQFYNSPTYKSLP